MSAPTQVTTRDATFMVLATISAFVSSCLLFMVQPMLAKWLLPSLGGTPATWSVCLATFQLLLLLGYGYVHWATLQLTSRAAARAQLALIPSACFALWQTDWSTSSVDTSALGIFALLVTRIGLPYTLLATTLPLLSHWSTAQGRRAVAALNISSNAGALLGLLSYPFLIEPEWAVPQQLLLWSNALLVFGGLMMATCTRRIFVAALESPTSSSEQPTFRKLSGWLLCALVPSALLLAATHHITTDIAATPLFWVVPLALYLLSFVIAFAAWRDTWRAPTLLLWGLATAALAVNAFTQGAASFTQQILATLLSTFAACLLCHGELAQSRPSAGLSLYYLVIAAGGALGGMLVGLLAPVGLDDQYELELTSLAVPIVVLLSSRVTHPSWSRSQRSCLALTAGLCLPLLLGSLWVRGERETRGGQVVERRRSLLGPLRVVDKGHERFLVHGRIQHGMQLRDEAQRTKPTLYFGPGTAAERILTVTHPERPQRIGIVGMGVGTLASYGRPGDQMRFYEIDGNVVELAQTRFSFLKDSSAHIEIVLGDGRLSLQREAPQHFDVLVLDAFSSDAVPVHLLTQEAFQTYRSHLADDGILLVNVSNRHLAVDRVVRASAQTLGWDCVLAETPTNTATHVTHVVWAVIAANGDQLASTTAGLPQLVPTSTPVSWTDSRTSVLSILR